MWYVFGGGGRGGGEGGRGRLSKIEQYTFPLTPPSPYILKHNILVQNKYQAMNDETSLAQVRINQKRLI